jgi:hypothetical protein
MFEIHVNAQDVVSTLDNLATAQIPFALSKALNAVGNDFQADERARFDAIFSLRRQEFIFRQGVKRLGGAATKANPSITFGQDPRADFLGKFEMGGPKTAIGGGNIAVPIDVRRNKLDIVTAANRPKALFDNNPDVFEIKPGDGNTRLAAGIYQRVGRGKRFLKKLYALEKSVPIAPVLGFELQAQQTVARQWPIRFGEAFAFALNTAR